MKKLITAHESRMKKNRRPQEGILKMTVSNVYENSVSIFAGMYVQSCAYCCGVTWCNDFNLSCGFVARAAFYSAKRCNKTVCLRRRQPFWSCIKQPPVAISQSGGCSSLAYCRKRLVEWNTARPGLQADTHAQVSEAESLHVTNELRERFVRCASHVARASATNFCLCLVT